MARPVEDETLELVPDEVTGAGPDVSVSKSSPDQHDHKDNLQPVSVSRLFSLARPLELLAFAAGILGAACWGFAQVAMNIFWTDLIDGLGGATDIINQINQIAISVCYLGLFTLVASGISGWLLPLFAELQSRKMQALYLDFVLHQDISWFDTHDVQALPTHIKEDVDLVKDAFDKIGTSCMGLSACISGYVIAFVRSWQLTLIFLGLIPLMGLGAKQMGSVIEAAVSESQQGYSQAASTVEESLFAMRTVVAFGKEQISLATLSRALEKARKTGVKTSFKAGFWLGFTWAVMFASYGVAFYTGMLFKYHGVKNHSTGQVWTPGNILAVFFCVLSGSFMLGNVAPGIVALSKAKTSAARFFAVLDSKPVIQCRGDDHRREITSIESMALNSVTFCYPARPNKQVLKGISLNIKKGQKVALVGESGCGKSTVVAMFDRFYNPSQGSVTINGEDVRELSTKSIRRLIGYVGQEPVLFAGTVRENVLAGNPSASKDLLDKVVQDAQLSFVNDLPQKLDTFVGSGGNQFSGGQKQRIAIARALIKKPSVLLLDEATSALDNAAERMIQDTLDNIKHCARDITMVSIAHRLSTIRDADVIFVLKEGQLKEEGTFNQLIEKQGEFSCLAASRSGAGIENGHPSEEGACDIVARQVSGSSVPSPESRKEQANTNTNSLATAQEQEIAREKGIAKAYKTPWGRLLSYCRPELPCLVPALLGALLNGASMPVVAVILVNSIDKFYITDRERLREELTLLSVYFVLIGVVNLVVQTMQYGCFGVIGQAMTKRMRVALFTHFLRQEIGFHDDPTHTPGKLAGAIRLWAFRVQAFLDQIGAASSTASSLLVGLGIAFVSSWQMTLVMLGAIPVMMICQALQVAVLLGGKSKEADSKFQSANQLVSDAVQAARTVHACGMEDQLVGMYTSYANPPLSPMRMPLQGFTMGITSSLPIYIMAAGFWVASKLVDAGIADFAGVMNAFMGILFAAMGAGMCFATCGDITKAKVAAHDMFQLLDRQTQIDGMNPRGATPSTNVGDIAFKRVNFAYPFRSEVQVLRDVSFSITAGQSVGLVGPSGGGKSTIMSLLQRFYDPQGGQVLVGKEQIPLSTLNVRWWRQQVGFVGQEPILFDTTIKANVLYGVPEETSITDAQLDDCKHKANLNFIDAESGKGWDTEVGPRGSRLSGGQKQRVAICRALVRNPAILLLDEATSALDNQSERVVQKALEVARQGRTSFVIAHRLSTIVDSDIILVAAEGTIVECGSHDHLIQKQGLYYSLATASDLPSERVQVHQGASGCNSVETAL